MLIPDAHSRRLRANLVDSHTLTCKWRAVFVEFEIDPPTVLKRLLEERIQGLERLPLQQIEVLILELLNYFHVGR